MNPTSQIDESLERGYNVRALRGDYDELLADWIDRSESFRAAADGVLDAAYGDGERQRLDVFRTPGAGPTLVYLHGGYWQRGDKSVYSFIAEPLVARGVNVVVMSYTLCPQATVPAITEEIRRGLVWLYRNGGGHGLAVDRINLTGHSAGGHLTAMMLTTPWPEIDSDLPAELVKTGIPISGLYDLEPLRYTTINQAAGIDAEAARSCSPLRLPPAGGAPVLAVVGGSETPAFHEQAADLAQQWTAAGTRVVQYVEPGADHFDVVNRLADPDSGLFGRVMEWLV